LFALCQVIFYGLCIERLDGPAALIAG